MGVSASFFFHKSRILFCNNDDDNSCWFYSLIHEVFLREINWLLSKCTNTRIFYFFWPKKTLVFSTFTIPFSFIFCNSVIINIYFLFTQVYFTWPLEWNENFLIRHKRFIRKTVETNRKTVNGCSLAAYYQTARNV